QPPGTNQTPHEKNLAINEWPARLSPLLLSLLIASLFLSFFLLSHFSHLLLISHAGPATRQPRCGWGGSRPRRWHAGPGRAAAEAPGRFVWPPAGGRAGWHAGGGDRRERESSPACVSAFWFLILGVDETCKQVSGVWISAAKKPRGGRGPRPFRVVPLQAGERAGMQAAETNAGLRGVDQCRQEKGSELEMLGMNASVLDATEKSKHGFLLLLLPPFPSCNCL
ncbi:unnamed protein product, partial [Urochloa humidicola]